MRRLLIAAVLAGAVSACNFAPSTYSTEFPEEREEIHLDRLPVDVIDYVGIVEGVVAVSGAEAGAADGVSVVGDDLRVSWSGGACESRVRLIVRAGIDSYFIRIDADQSVGGMLGCPAVTVQRVVRIKLTDPTEGGLFDLLVEESP